MALDPPNELSPNVRYAFKAALIGAAHQFELTDDGLSWRIAGKSGVWPYTSISSIRLSYRPVSMQSRRFRADIEREGGGHIRLLSITWQTATLMAPQGKDFHDFIVQLHRRMAEAGSHAALIGGLSRRAYLAAAVVLGLLGIAMAGLFIRAIATLEFTGALFLLGFAALFAWQVGGFVRRNRPQTYTFEHLPEGLLP
jgi:hypothetical protein